MVVVGMILSAGESELAVDPSEAQAFQVSVDDVAAVMPQLPPEAQPLRDRSQELAGLLLSASDEGLSYTDVMPDVEGLVNEPGYRDAWEAAQAFVGERCPPAA